MSGEQERTEQGIRGRVTRVRSAQGCLLWGGQRSPPPGVWSGCSSQREEAGGWPRACPCVSTCDIQVRRLGRRGAGDAVPRRPERRGVRHRGGRCNTHSHRHTHTHTHAHTHRDTHTQEPKLPGIPPPSVHPRLRRGTADLPSGKGPGWGPPGLFTVSLPLKLSPIHSFQRTEWV